VVALAAVSVADTLLIMEWHFAADMALWPVYYIITSVESAVRKPMFVAELEAVLGAAQEAVPEVAVAATPEELLQW
jgi:hypothetical protein